MTAIATNQVSPTIADSNVFVPSYDDSIDAYDEYTEHVSFPYELRVKYFGEFMEHSRLLPNTTAEDPKLLECFVEFVENRLNTSIDLEGCPVKFDGVSCWPRTAPGTLREIPCFEKLYGILYDRSDNATLYCHENGTWAEKATYNCTALENTEEHTESKSIRIMYIGYSLSLVAVLFALWIFISFKDLRCLRNTIHTNLLATYLLQNLFWIIYATWQSHFAMALSCFIFVCLNYLSLTNFVWMFVEGLYLYMLVVQTFSAENIKLRVYILIGWGLPIPIVLTWLIIRLETKKAQLQTFELIDDIYANECPLIEEMAWDWFIRVPVLFALTLNILFLIQIMWVLITKLRSANTVETQRYWKASKALLVLIPLLGLTYMLLIALPQQLENYRAILLSTQGFWVAIFYCFLNSEVRNSIRHHIERWRTERGIAHSRGVSMRNCRDSPPRTRGDRLGKCSRRLFGGKRESLCCSEVTTMTTFVTNGYNLTTSTPPQLTSSSQSAAAAAASLQVSNASLPLSTSGLPLHQIRSASLTPSMAASTAFIEAPPQRSGSQDAML